ncbi:MAG: DUF1571 domain-containing protein [Gemmataceae bacterium]|nr:DUF1571 domain-containing protein [Gemmataceae bacterium]
MPSFIGFRRRTADTGSGRNRRGLTPYLLAGLFLAALVAGMTLAPDGAGPVSATQTPPTSQPYTPPQQPVAQPAAPQSPLDAPLRLLNEGRQTYQRVTDYTCTLISQERVRGKLLPENVISFYFRNQPYSVYMKWIGPKDMVGQEVAYVHGRNKNQMRVYAGHIALGKVRGWMPIAPNDPKVLEHSNHIITEAGIANLMEQLARSWEAERRLGKTQVQMAEYEYAQRRCTRVESVRSERAQGVYCYRSVVYFDKETRLPIRMENYDWPRPGGPPQGELMECFSYINLRFNVGLNDQLFNR